MSDTQGAPDTASGGLENDMPAIGSAAPSPRMVPQSGLSGIAQFAQRALGLGGPARQPVRPPWMQGPQGSPPPPNQRWGGTTASMFLPRGANQPPARFTPYIGALPKGDFRKWGQPDENGASPQSFELPSITQGLSQFFGQAGGGSDLTAIMALGMGRYAGDYIKGVMQGQEFKAKMAQEKWLEHAQALQEQLETRHQIYANRIGEYAAVAGTDDPQKLGTATIKGVSLRDALHMDAMKTGDTDVINMLDEGVPLDKLLRYQDLRDSKLKDLQATTKKAAEQKSEDDIWDNKTPGSESGGGVDPFSLGRQTPSGQAQAPQPSAAPDGSPAPSPTQGPPSQVAQAGGPDQTQQQQDQAAGLTPEDAATLQAARGYELDPKMAPNHRQVALRDSEALKAKLQDIISNPNLTGEQVRDAVRAIPKYGRAVDAELNGVASYKQPIGGQTGISTGGRQGEWSGPDGILAHLTQKYDPNWNQAYYHDRDRFRTDATTQMTLLRTSGISADANAVLEDLKVLEKSGRAATGLDLKQVIENAAKDPMYVGLAADWQAYNDAFNTIVSGGRHTVSGTREQVSVAPTSYASPAAFRAAMKGHMNDAYGIIDGLHRRWQSIGGKTDDMPSYDANLEKNIRDIRDMDWFTGTYPGDPYTNPKTGRTQIWRPKADNTRNPFDKNNWADK